MDSYLDRLGNYVQDGTLKDLCGLKFTNMVTWPGWEQSYYPKYCTIFRTSI